MTQQLEDRLRAAFREKAEQIPAVAPPLELAPRPRRAARLARVLGLGRLKPGQRKLVTALAAAAAVAAVAVGAVIASSPSAPPPQLPGGGPAAKPPSYYVATGGPSAVVRATSTGTVIARVGVPRPYTEFRGVTSAADDRTFVLEAVSFANVPVPQKLYLLRINPSARLPADRARLTPLGVQFPGGTGVQSMALSPDGRSLAVVEVHGTGTANFIVIYNLDTGGSHSWSLRNCRGDCNIGANQVGQGEMNVISWTADGRRLGFVQQSGATGQFSQFRLLNVRAPGDNVLADSRPVTLQAAPGALQGADPRDAGWGIAVITPDGGSVILDAANITHSGQPVPPQSLLRYSARTGTLQAVLGVRPNRPGGYADQVQWTSSDGSTILVTGFRGRYSAGLLHGGQYTPLPWSAAIQSAAW